MNTKTDKQIIETLNNIKKHCTGRSCENCSFKSLNNPCQIAHIAKKMAISPSQWDMEEIERLVNL